MTATSNNMANVMPTTDTATSQAMGELHFTIFEAPAHVPKSAAGQAEEVLDFAEVDSPSVADFKKTLLSVKVSKLCKAQKIKGSEMLGQVIYDWSEILKNDKQLQKELTRIALSWFVRHENFGKVLPILRISEFIRPTLPTAAVPKEATKAAQKRKGRDGPEAEITKARATTTVPNQRQKQDPYNALHPVLHASMNGFCARSRAQEVAALLAYGRRCKHNAQWSPRLAL
ncbi:hypothetical protein BKA70DRAFT_1439047 [Coprinopsis sp. MPI-PUGE-AT-0042]|nr:hypothetical protein BKA70DRAFT_1439047 [Coprinopsis sp. MPI-PUGE-AT-0042]